MDDILFSLNIILPLVLLVMIGYTLRKTSLLSPEFYPSAEKLVFKIALPCSLFTSIYNADPSGAFNPKLIVFCTVGIAVTFLVPCFIVPVFLKDNQKRGAFIQGVYRSNFAILGLPIAERLFGATGTVVATSLMPFSIPLFNIFAVIILSIFAPSDKKMTKSQIAVRSVKGIVTNPLIIGIALALPFMITGIRLPEMAVSTIGYLGKLTTPLALICLGASMSGTKSKSSSIVLASIAAVIKIVVIPAALVIAAILFGFRGVELGTIFILFGGPTAVSSYIMAKNMKSDHALAGQILILTTVLCSVTVFVAIFLLKHFSLI